MPIEPEHPRIAIVRQCELLGISRSGPYYRPRRDAGRDDPAMRPIDEQYTRTPFYGVRRMRVWLAGQGHRVNHKRVRRLMRAMGLEAIYPKPRLSRSAQQHRKYPYLLRGLAIERPDQVWATDITYIRMRRGFICLAAIMDWASRYVLSWEVSVSLEAEFRLTCLERALAASQPEIFNSDQGSQFTSAEFTGQLEERGVAIGMDGRGRVWDNIFIERLWRSVKCEEVYLRDYQSVAEARRCLGTYLAFYNSERPHQSLAYATPANVYFEGRSGGGEGIGELAHVSTSNSVSLLGGGAPSPRTALPAQPPLRGRGRAGCLEPFAK